MKFNSIHLLKAVFLLVTLTTTTGFKFEQFYKYSKSGRVGLTIHNGEYGDYVYNGVLINKIGSNDDTPLNRWFQWGLHNSYIKDETTLYDILKNDTTDIELDIHPTGVIGGDNQNDWAVKHTKSDTYSNCRLHNSTAITSNLSHCLQTIKKFHDDYPNHHLITLRIELKDDALKPFTSDFNHSAFGLDQLLERELGDLLYTPADLKGNYSSLRTAAAAGWPTLGELKGKVMVVLFDPLPNDNQELREYLDVVNITAKAFVAPRIFSLGTAYSVDAPKNFTDSMKDHIVMYCLWSKSYAVHAHGPDIMSKGRLSMTYGVDAGNTPGVSEYRDFFIQRGRGDGTSGDRNPVWAYSGRLADNDVGNTAVPPVMSLGTSTVTSSKPNGIYCLAVEGNSTSNKADIHFSSCDGGSDQQFAIIDAAIDYDNNDMPTSRGYIVQAINTDADGDANQKVMELQGYCCGNGTYGREVFQYTRDATRSNNRPEDQYWLIEALNDGIQIKSAVANYCLASRSSSASLGYCGSTLTGRYFRPFE
ncbi:MAG: Ca2+-dependent phosphoinositide-specific phospholipase C [Psychrosphaera sp.]|nr:Ca2+-dependent phosphoinositide-specific phospholipase C [Psychrosphaera sp.]